MIEVSDPPGPTRTLMLTDRPSRRQFLQQGLAATATAAMASSTAQRAGAALDRETQPVSLPSGPVIADALLFIWLPGGVSQTDTWDPKPVTPFQNGMTGTQIQGTCESIPTAAADIRLGKGLERFAEVMDRATIVRNLVPTPPPSLPTAPVDIAHQPFQRHFLTGQWERPRPSTTAAIEIRAGRTVFESFVKDESDSRQTQNRTPLISSSHEQFAVQLDQAADRIRAGQRFVQVTFYHPPFEGFDTHERGATRMLALKRQIDGPLASLIGKLEKSHSLDRTVVLIASEFGRTVAHPSRTLTHRAQFGCHAHAAVNTALLLGGPFQSGQVIGQTTDHHPLAPLGPPMTTREFHNLVAGSLGATCSGDGG